VTADTVIRLVPPLILSKPKPMKSSPGSSPGSSHSGSLILKEYCMKHYLQFSDFTADEYDYLLERAALIKKKFKGYESTTR
jgi:hypothetical protein